MAEPGGEDAPGPGTAAPAAAPVAGPPTEPGGAAGVSGLSQFVLVHKHRQVWIKFSCPCGQRLLFPTHSPKPVGRCGRCGREHRLVGMEKRIAAFEKHLHAAQAAHDVKHPAATGKAGQDESLVTRLLKPSDYAAAAGPEFRPPEPDSFQAFYHNLVGDRRGPEPDRAVPPAGAPAHQTGGIPPQHSGTAPAADTGAHDLGAAETVELPPHQPAIRPAAAEGERRPAGSGSRGAAQPGETSMLTDFDLAPFEPLNSARIRETADLAADRLRPRASQPQPATQPGGLIWAWPPATPFQRMLAAGVDLMAPALGAVAVAFFARLAGADTGTRLGVAWLTLVTLGLSVDLIGAIVWRGASPGKRLSGIHVRQQGGQLPGRGMALLRSLLKWGLTPAIWWVAAVDSQARCLHDLICRTRVLYGRPR